MPVVEEIVITKKDGTTGGGGGTMATQGKKEVKDHYFSNEASPNFSPIILSDLYNYPYYLG